jgi:hypothetical protein
MNHVGGSGDFDVGWPVHDDGARAVATEDKTDLAVVPTFSVW